MVSEYRVNNQIKATSVRLVDSIGQQVGVVSIKEAIIIARNSGLDLVEIADKAIPPVCKILDYNKFKYEEAKKEKDIARKNREATVETKEIRLRPVTDEHDVEIKCKKIREFLEDGNKVNIIIKFKGREASHMDIGRTLLEKMLILIGTHKVDKPISVSDSAMTVMVSSLVKKKVESQCQLE